MSLFDETLNMFEIANTKPDKLLPGNAFFYDNNTVVNLPREDGDSRYPLDVDGYTLWTYASGYIHAREGRLYTLGWRQDGDEPEVDFFAGLHLNNGKYKQISLLGVPVKDDESVKRFTVFTPYATYYLTEISCLKFCVRAFVTAKKKVVFSVICINNSKEPVNISLSSYLNPLNKCERNKDYDFRWFERTEVKPSVHNNLNSAISTSGNIIGAVANSISEKPTQYYCTSSRASFAGGKNRSIGESKSVANGKIAKENTASYGTDDGVYADLKTVSIKPSGYIRNDITYTVFHKDDFNTYNDEIIPEIIDGECEEIKSLKAKSDAKLNIKFGKSRINNIDNETFNNFISFLKRQTYFSAFTKYYAWSERLGMRDIWQHSEPSLLWAKNEFEKMALDSLSVIEENGRVPREYAPSVFSFPIMFNLQKKPDQGMWIISTMFTYLSATNNWDFLDKECGYFCFPENDPQSAHISDIKETVLEHLIRIMDYLVSIIASDTGCVRVLLGDWNDLLIGMGDSLDGTDEFGTGSSIMASLQVYKNLKEMQEILTHHNSNKYKEKITEYEKIVKRLEESIIKNAVQTNSNGEKRIIHGWGDKKSFLVGSFNDGDGKSRISSIDHSFWLISGIIEKTPELFDMIVSNLKKCDDIYGIRTFKPPFESDFTQLRGISTCPEGMLENGSTYIHCAMFAVLALMKYGQTDFAFEQLSKLLPFTHNNVSHSPFVMSNSYMQNEHFGVDGVSINDWQTGSAAVLMKIIINQICGFVPTLDGLVIAPCRDLPFESFSFTLKNERFDVSITYISKGTNRKFRLNGNEYPSVYDSSIKTEKIFIPNEEIEKYGKLEIVIEN